SNSRTRSSCARRRSAMGVSGLTESGVRRQESGVGDREPVTHFVFCRLQISDRRPRSLFRNIKAEQQLLVAQVKLPVGDDRVSPNMAGLARELGLLGKVKPPFFVPSVR